MPPRLRLAPAPDGPGAAVDDDAVMAWVARSDAADESRTLTDAVAEALADALLAPLDARDKAIARTRLALTSLTTVQLSMVATLVESLERSNAEGT